MRSPGEPSQDRVNIQDMTPSVRATAAITVKTDPRCADEEKKTGCVPVIQINNVEVDERGHIYAVDRANTGLFVLELTGEARAIANLPR